MNKNTMGVALTKCFYCLESNEIVMNTRLSHQQAEKIEAMNGMVVHMEPCPKCAELMDKGVILITIDDDKSEPDWNKQPMPNPYRTGGWFVVRDCSLDFLPDELRQWAIDHRWMFIEHEAAEAIGLFAVAGMEAT